MLNIDNVFANVGLPKKVFIYLYKEFNVKYPYTYNELSALSGNTNAPLTHFQIALVLIEQALDEINLSWDDWDIYVSLIVEDIRYDSYSTVGGFGGRSVGWTNHTENNNNDNDDCSITTNTAINALNQITWMS